MITDLMNSLSLGARQLYTKNWNLFQTFTRKTLKSPSLPASQHTVAMYVTHLHHSNLRSTTIRTHLSSVAFFHKINGYPSPTESFIVKKLLSGYSKNESTIIKRKPINLKLLNKITEKISDLQTTKYEKTMYRALFSIMYHAALRISEVAKSKTSTHTLLVHQLLLKIKKHNYIKIKLPSHKHSKTKPAPIILKPTDNNTCPIRHYNKYLQIRPKSTKYAFCHQNSEPIKRKQVSSMLRTIISLLGYNSKQYNTHSFRIGKATDMAVQGYTPTQISLLGRWNSTAYLKYIKPKRLHSY